MRKAAGGRLETLALGTLGILLFLVAWEVVGRLRLLGLTWPPLTDVLRFLADPSRFGLFGRALGATLDAFATGYVLGVAAGVAVAVAAHLAMPLKTALDRTSAFLNAIPSIALAPFLIIFLGRNATPTALAMLNAFFILYVATSSALRARAQQWSDLFTVLGAGRWTRLRRLDIPAALPTIASGMRLAAPACLIGVIIGEWFGSPRGIGVLIINAMQNFQIPLLWSAVLLVVAISLTLFGLLGALQRYVADRFR